MSFFDEDDRYALQRRLTALVADREALITEAAEQIRAGVSVMGQVVLTDGEARRAAEAGVELVLGRITDIITELHLPTLWDEAADPDAVCAKPTCGHAYYRHFDTYEDMAPVGCKYCGCYQFVAATGTPVATPTTERA